MSFVEWWHSNGNQIPMTKQFAREAWYARDAEVAAVEREMVALREPGPCGKHPLACYHKHSDSCYGKVSETEGTGEYLRCGLVAGCGACVEQASLQSRIDEARKLAPKWRKDAETSSIGIYLHECADEIEAVLDRKES